MKNLRKEPSGTDEALLALVLGGGGAPAEGDAAGEEEAQGVPRNGRREDAHVEGHDREHYHVGDPDAEGVDGGLGEPPGEPGGPAAAVAVGREAPGGVGEELDGGGEGEDEAEREEVGADALAAAGPAGEEDLHVLPPEEGHVHPPHAHVV